MSSEDRKSAEHRCRGSDIGRKTDDEDEGDKPE